MTGEATADYHDGPQYPHLVRIDGTPDCSSQIIKSLQGRTLRATYHHIPQGRAMRATVVAYG